MIRRMISKVYEAQRASALVDDGAPGRAQLTFEVDDHWHIFVLDGPRLAKLARDIEKAQKQLSPRVPHARDEN